MALSQGLVYRFGLVFGLLVATCAGQEFQIGGGGGYGLYRKTTVFAPAGQVTAGIRSRFVLTAWITDDLYEHVSGEFRYTYQDGDPYLQQGADRVNLQGQSHAFDYDILWHIRNTDRAVRPFIVTGLGVKRYLVSGPPNPSQPFTEIATLNDTHDTRFLVILGGGVNLKLGARWRLQFDVRDYITKFPKELISPAPYGTARGLFQQITPMIGLAYAFGKE
jgi:hypothetical protein